MSSEEPIQNDSKAEPADQPQTPTEPAAMAAGTKKRPRLELNAIGATGKERKRGKSMFGILVGTLNKAKIEDKERNASDAAKKRQLIEQRLQMKLRKETDTVRRAEEAKKDKTTANRKEEDLQLKDSIYKLRRKRLPLLSNFLLTSDVITSDNSSPPPSTNPLGPIPRTHPPPLYYLPAILTPAQEAFLSRRQTEAAEAAEKEWETFQQERATGIEEISKLRQKVAEEESRQKSERGAEKEDMETDAPVPNTDGIAGATPDNPPSTKPSNSTHDVDMEVDDGGGPKHEEVAPPNPEPEKKEEPTPMHADDDDAVEY